MFGYWADRASSPDDGWFIGHAQFLRGSLVSFPLLGVPQEGGGGEAVDEHHEPGQEEADVETVDEKIMF